MIRLRSARAGEEAPAFSFIESARAFQWEQGFRQWTEAYPDIGQVREDIAAGTGYFLLRHEVPVGYLCIDFSGEPVYDDLDGHWLTDRPYAVLHRIALSPTVRGTGATAALFSQVKELCRSRGVSAIRIDTCEKNMRMRHIIEREGFRYCGIIDYYSPDDPARPDMDWYAYELDFE